jgi:hypothetical protein
MFERGWKMKNCSICKAPIEDENPSILTMGGYGNPRYVCGCCDEEMERMLYSRETSEIQTAMKILGDHLARIGCEDNAVINTMEEMFARATARAEAIREGSYDFAEDEAVEDSEEMVEIPEELRESEEDRILDEKEEEQAKKFDKVMDYVWLVFLILFGIAAAYFLIRKIF